MIKKITALLSRLLDSGNLPNEDINKVRRVRQVNGLNMFFVFVAGSVTAIFLIFMPEFRVLIQVQTAAFFLYGLNIFLNLRKQYKLAAELTIIIFEIHLLVVVLYTGGLHSPAMSVTILFPLLAALVESSIALHVSVSLLGFGIFYFLHRLAPATESFWTLGGGTAEIQEILVIMQYTYFPVMAAVIIGIIFTENLKAREKLKEMLKVITSSKVQLEFYANELKDETQKLRAELNIAKKIQTMVLPTEEEIREIPELDIACFMRPADEVGGDYYDIIKIGGKLMIGIGDVTGHGLSSGIVMLMAQTAIRTLAEFSYDDPARFLRILNRVLYSNTRRIGEEKSMTLSLVFCMDGHYSVSGQHESIVICRADGTIQVLDTTDSGFYIGMVAESPDQPKGIDFTMEKDDVMFLYSDGVTEAINGKKEQFGLENLCRVLRNHHRLPATGIKDKFTRDLYNYIGEADIYDDISFMVVKQC